MHKGAFFNSVMANMSRRMNPASPADSSPMELMNKGVCMTKYVERYGGFGRSREMGYVMWQVAMIMDYLQNENWNAAKDSTALLSVCLEQTAMDSTMDVGLLLALVEDPPSGLFSSRSLAPLSRGRSFAPLADQKVGGYRFELHQGVGSDHSASCRCLQLKGFQFDRWPTWCSKDEAKAPAKGDMEKEAEGHRRFGGGLNDGSHQLVASSGDGACPGDLCCPDPGLLRFGADPSGGAARAKKPKKQKKKYGPFESGSSKVWPGIGAQDEPIQQSITFLSLAASLPRWILVTRTRFAAYLAKTFHLQCGGSSPSTVVFPLPLADFGLFKAGAPRLPRRRFLTLVRKRILHTVIVALNYLHDGFRGGDVQLLGRRPNDTQRAIHQRLWSLVAACDTPGEVPLSPGRSGNEFIARLRTLEEFAKTCPSMCEDLYEEGPQDFERPVGFTSNDVYEPVPKDGGQVDGDLAAYRPLDVSRLKLTGQGEWDLAAHLHDELWLPYVEPMILRHDRPVDFQCGPNFAFESKEENLRLAKLWSTKGLLELSLDGAPGGLSSRVFNNYKNL